VTAGRSERTGAQQTQVAGGVTLTNEQRMRIRETVLARSDVPRVDANRVDFALVAGTTVPTYVRVVEVPDTLIMIHPDWRGDMYFVTGDEVIIVDHSRRIVATLLLDSGTCSSMVNERGSTTMHLSRDEIRQVQIVLNQQGFNVGEPDGILGARTREALIAFQRKRGFQASGQIDQQTVAALGVTGATGHQGNQAQPSTADQTGQSGAGMNQPSVRQGTATGQPSTQGSAATHGSAGQNQNWTTTQDRGATSTTGQGNPPAQQPAAPNAGGSSSMLQRQSR
jgi:peptidoglycan hydrolase-like protein with peptidoglycan-binding domain